MITAAMGFALGGVAAKVLREADMDAFRLTQIRITGAAILLLSFALYKGKKQLHARKDELKDLLLFGIVGVSAVTSFYFFAIKYLYVSVALVIEFTASIWIVLYLRFVKKKQISPIMWWGIACAFSGLFLLGLGRDVDQGRLVCAACQVPVDCVVAEVGLAADIPAGKWRVGEIKNLFRLCEPVDIGGLFGPEGLALFDGTPVKCGNLSGHDALLLSAEPGT